MGTEWYIMVNLDTVWVHYGTLWEQYGTQLGYTEYGTQGEGQTPVKV